jgi:hypothetical protein
MAQLVWSPTRSLWLIILATASLAFGCAHRPGVGFEGSGVGGGGVYGMSEPDAEYRRGRGSVAKRAERAPAGPPPPSMVAAPASDMDEQEDTVIDEDAADLGPRMVHYNGYAQLRVARPSELVAEVSELAESVGGYVERSTNTSVTVRVPVDSFRAAFDDVLDLGEVLRKSMTARDVTDAHYAADLRLRIATKTRNRLQQLLARAKDEKEKLAILREIQRLTEQIDRLQRQTKTLESLASMSRLSVDAVGASEYSTDPQHPAMAGFEWIEQLSPFSRAVADNNDSVDIDVPEGLVELGDSAHFQAESADGVVVWTARIDNAPEGDANFWMAALRSRIESQFANPTVGTVGGYLTLRLEEPSKEPYIYTLALRIDGDTVELIEWYAPDAAAEARHKVAVEAVLTGRTS